MMGTHSSSSSTSSNRHRRPLRCVFAATSLWFFLSAGSNGGSTSRKLSSGPQVNEVIHALKNRHKPFVVIHDYWPREKALLAADEAKKAIKDCHQVVDLDYRRMGSNLVGGFPLAEEFANDKYLKLVAKKFLAKSFFGARVRVKAQYGITLRSGDSGAGWHQDIPTVVNGKVQRGIKALMYLQDVTENNGPFQLLLGYNTSALRHAFDERGRKTRYSEEHVRLQKEKYGAYTHKILGNAGTVVLFEISNIHRGGVVREDGRISLTNYYNTPVAIARCAEGLNVYSDLSKQNYSAEDRAEGLKLLNIEL